MRSIAIELALALICVAALGRVVGILLIKLRRQSRYAKQAVALPRSWRDLCTVPEPYLLGVTTLALWLGREVPAQPSLAGISRVGAGALLALLAIGLMLWVLRAFPGVSTGHYVLPDQRVVREGPYALVRHPLYLAAYLVWAAVAAGFGSLVALALTVAYVIPGYWIYMRAEERMLRAHLGEAYARYQEDVGMLVPRLRRARGGAAGASASDRSGSVDS
jgi:protein-S-isoprenylcysteine O-methyltransferase Ste14